MLNFIENIIKEKTRQYSNVLKNDYKNMADEINALNLPEDKVKKVLEVVGKYVK